MNNVKEIITRYLTNHNCSGLYNDDLDCLCHLADLMPCIKDPLNCHFIWNCEPVKKNKTEMNKSIKELTWALSAMITIFEDPTPKPDHICGTPDAVCDCLCQSYADEGRLLAQAKEILNKYSRTKTNKS